MPPEFGLTSYACTGEQDIRVLRANRLSSGLRKLNTLNGCQAEKYMGVGLIGCQVAYGNGERPLECSLTR